MNEPGRVPDLSRTRRARAKAALLVSAMLGSLLGSTGLGACASDPRVGYAFEAEYPTDVQTVRVPVFDNHTFAHGIEAQLTEAIAKELLRATPYKVTTSADADTVLTGVITSVDMRTLSRDSDTGYVQELAVRVTIDFDWRDTRNGKLLVSRRGFSGVDTFVPTARTRETVEYGQTATVQRLANDVVRTLRSGW